jgi:hypothetical protein
MIGRRSTIGVALLCAFAFCVFAAQSAMAQTGEKAVNTTAVTCVPQGEGNFEDSHCDKKSPIPGTGKFEHAPITKDTTTEIEVTGEGSFTLTGVLAGVNAEITCKKAQSVAGKSFLHNVETSGKHTVTGTVLIHFSECEVKKPTKCTLKEPVVTTANFEGVEKLGPSKNEMGVEFKGEGAEGSFAELTFQNKGEEKCSLTNGGKPFLVQGSAIATGQTATQSESYSGATSKYELGPENNRMETLTIGGKPQTFTGTFTTRMAGGDPIALTTTT